MSYSFEYIDIILLAMIAGFIFLRLRGILGKRTGYEGKSPAQFKGVLKNIRVDQPKKSNDKFDKSTRIQADYSSLKGNKYLKPTIKKYLYRQVRSSFLRIDVDEMALACYLPVARFSGATLGSVFAQARKVI